MSLEDPQPVSGTLTRTRPDGTTEVIEMTVDEVKGAPNKYLQSECKRILVLYDDGEVRRPYRFVDSQPYVREVIDPETGERMIAY